MCIRDSTGPDSPGLVSNVAALLARHGLNISSLDTRVVGVAPEGLQRRVTEAARSLDARDAATDLFCLEAIVTAPEKPDAAALKRDARHSDLQEMAVKAPSPNHASVTTKSHLARRTARRLSTALSHALPKPHCCCEEA